MKVDEIDNSEDVRSAAHDDDELMTLQIDHSVCRTGDEEQ